MYGIKTLLFIQCSRPGGFPGFRTADNDQMMAGHPSHGWIARNPFNGNERDVPECSRCGATKGSAEGTAICTLPDQQGKMLYLFFFHRFHLALMTFSVYFILYSLMILSITSNAWNYFISAYAGPMAPPQTGKFVLIGFCSIDAQLIVVVIHSMQAPLSLQLPERNSMR
jgi:hypothetical protein